MSDETDRSEAQFAPSSNRINRAREHGMFPYSSQMAAAIQLTGAIGGMMTLVALIGQGLGEWTQEYWGTNAIQLNHDVVSLAGGSKLAIYLLLLLAVFFLVNFASHVVQKGLTIPQRQLFDISNLMPFTRPSPVTWSDRAWQLALRLAQTIAVVVVGFYYLKMAGWKLLALWQTSKEEFPRQLASSVLSFAMAIALALLAVSLVDYLWQTLLHHRRLMMTEAELKEENRTEEGNPQLRTQRRNQHRRMIQVQSPHRQAEYPNRSM